MKESKDQYEEKLQQEIHHDPAFTVDVSPVVGAHNGIGTVGIGIMHR